MSKIFYTSDLHCGHYNIIKFDNRPYSTVDEMNKALINNWNSVVSKNDEVYHLGDFCWGKTYEWIELLKQLNGRIHLVKGNHDYKQCPSELKPYIVEYADKIELNDGGRHVILSHYPELCYKSAYNPNCYMLHGHTHTTREQDFVEKWTKELRATRTNSGDSCGNIFNVGCMLHDYTPRTLDEIIERFNKRLDERGISL